MAKGKIRGITVEIGGDTTKLGKALREVDATTKGLQKELKGVNTLLDHDPKNVDLLKQKQELLTKSIAETKSKLEILKSTQEQVQAQFDRGEITAEQYRDFQREIAATEQRLKNLTTEMKNFGSVSAQQIAAAGEKMKDIGDKVEGAGKKLAPASAAVAGLGVVAVKTAADFDSSMSQVAAVSGAQGDELQQLRDKAREMGAQTKFSAFEAADAMNYMAMAGWKTEDMLGGVEGIMNLAAASGEDLANTSDIVTDGLTAFGLSAQDSGRMADVMAAASSNANTNVSLLGESYKYCASTAGAMGYSLEDVTESLGLMANAGVKGSQAGNTLKNAMINLAKPTDAMAATMKQYHISITNSDGSMKSWNEIVTSLRENLGGLTEAEQTAAVATLFGKEATAGMLSLINAAPADIEKLNGAILNSNGTAKEMADIMQDNLNGQLQTLKSQLQELAISIGDALMPIIRSLVEHLQGIVEKFNSLSDGQKQVIVIVGLIVAALAPVLIIVGQLITSVGVIATALPTLTTALGALKVAFAAIGGPVTIVIAVITALVLKFIHAYNTSETFRNKVNAVFDAVGSKVSAVINTIIGLFRGMISYYANAINEIKTAWSALVSWFSGKVSEFVSIGRNVLMGLWNGINDKVAWLKSKVKGVVDKIKSWFTGKDGFDTHSPSKWSEKIGGFVMEGLANGVSNNTTALQAVQQATEKIKTAITDKMNSINAEIAKIQKEAEDERAKEELDQYKQNLAKKQDELKKAEPKNRQSILDEIAKIEKDWNKKQIEAARTAEQQRLQERLTALQEFKQEYESELSAIEQKQSSLNDKLADYGDLFTRIKDDETGKEIFKLGDLDESIRKIEKYNAQIEALKEKGLSDGLLNEIANLSIDDALDFTAKLDALSPQKFEEFVAKYEEKQRVANETAKLFYLDEMEELKNSALEKAASYGDDFIDVGLSITDGVVQGVKDGKSGVVNSIVDTVKAAIKAAKAAADIHSPSRVMRDEVGKPLSQGVALGVTDEADKPVEAVGGVVRRVIENGVNVSRDIKTTFRRENSGIRTGDIMALLSDYLPQLLAASGRQIVLDSGAVVGGTIDMIDSKLGQNALLKARGV